MEDVLDRFLRYVKIDTQSEENGLHPSTGKQFVLARLLTEELKAMGADQVYLDEEFCYVYAVIPSNLPEGTAAPAVGFLAHMDTSPAVSGAEVKPRVVRFTGEDVDLGGDGKYILSMRDFPFMKSLIGEELVVTDGSTLLGADDKAGVAEIMAMAETLLTNPEIRHGKLCLCFTPDEEVGGGTAKIDLKRFGADFGYTVDGGPLGGMEYENFNAASGFLTVRGRSIHPGSAKNTMRNALLMAMEFQSLLPAAQDPMYTEGYEGFYHPDEIHGACDCVTVDYIIRDHDRAKFEAKKLFFKNAAAFMNEKYGEGSFKVDMADSYYNMREKIEEHMEVVRIAEQAMRNRGLEPKTIPIRGGTDGARLSYMGLPCPNICTGGFGFHSRFEFIPTFALTEVSNIIIEIIKLSAE